MGDRYILKVSCPNCGAVEEDVYYAPTCDFVTHTCSKCGTVIDLAKYTGISYQEASNLVVIQGVLGVLERQI